MDLLYVKSLVKVIQILKGRDVVYYLWTDCAESSPFLLHQVGYILQLSVLVLNVLIIHDVVILLVQVVDDVL